MAFLDYYLNLCKALRSKDASMSCTSSRGVPTTHGHKGDPEVTPKICGAIGERAQVILVWVRASGVENASHLWRLAVIRIGP